MAEIVLTATIAIETEMTCRLSMAEYIWTTESDIQRYLNDESVIDISDTYTQTDAQNMENGVVREIIAYLSSFYEIDEDSNVPLLKELTAQLTAAKIGMAYSSAIANDPISFAYRYENNVWDSLRLRAKNQDISELVIKDIPLWKRLLYSKKPRNLITQEVR